MSSLVSVRVVENTIGDLQENCTVEHTHRKGWNLSNVCSWLINKFSCIVLSVAHSIV